MSGQPGQKPERTGAPQAAQGSCDAQPAQPPAAVPRKPSSPPRPVVLPRPLLPRSVVTPRAAPPAPLRPLQPLTLPAKLPAATRRPPAATAPGAASTLARTPQPEPRPAPPLPVRTASGATSTSPARSIARPAWRRDSQNCGHCGLPVGRESLVHGTAQWIEGNLVCADCMRLRTQQTHAKMRSKPAWVAPLAALLITALCGVLFPAQACFLILLVGLLAVVVAGLGFTLRAPTRLILGGAGLAASLTCLALIFWLQDRAHSRSLAEALDRERTQIQQLLLADDFAGAFARLQALRANAITQPSEEAQNSCLEVQNELDAWLQRTYPCLDPQLRAPLISLLNTSGAGAKRFQALTLEQNVLQLRLATTWSAETVVARKGSQLKIDEPALRDAIAVVRPLWDAVPAAQTIEVQLCQADGTPCGELRLPKSSYLTLCSGTLEEVAACFEAH